MIFGWVLLNWGPTVFAVSAAALSAESHNYAGALALFGTLAIVFGAFGAYGQTDFKRLVAYSSINHMGFVILAVAAAAWATGTQNAVIAMNGPCCKCLTTVSRLPVCSSWLA